MKTKKRKCDFCGKTLDTKRVYKWRDRIFCSANCKRGKKNMKNSTKKKNDGILLLTRRYTPL